MMFQISLELYDPSLSENCCIKCFKVVDTRKPFFNVVLLAIVFNIFLANGDQTPRDFTTRGTKAPPDLVTKSKCLVSLSFSHVLAPVPAWVAAF